MKDVKGVKSLYFVRQITIEKFNGRTCYGTFFFLKLFYFMDDGVNYMEKLKF